MSEDISGPLVQMNTTWQAITISTSVPEVKAFRDKAAAIEVWLREQRAGSELQNYVAEHKLRAERRLGEMLAEMEKNRGGNPNLLHDATGSPSTLTELGIERTASHRWQLIASLAHEAFEAYLAETKATGGELTSAGMLRVARREQLITYRHTPDAVRDPSLSQAALPVPGH